MTKTQRGVEGEIDERMPQLVRLMHAAWRQGVHVAWTIDGEVVIGGPDTPAARSAVGALLPYGDLLSQTGLLALADEGIPPMGSVDEAQGYVRHAIARDRAGGPPAFLKLLGIGAGASKRRTSDVEIEQEIKQVALQMLEDLIAVEGPDFSGDAAERLTEALRKRYPLVDVSQVYRRLPR